MKQSRNFSRDSQSLTKNGRIGFTNCSGHLQAFRTPGLQMKRAKQWTAKDLGIFLGRQNAIEAVMWGEVPLSSKVQQEGVECLASLDKVFGLSSNPNMARATKKFERGMKKWRPIFKRFIDETLSSARKRPYPQAAAFLEAFGKANVIKPDDLASENRLGVSEKIAWVMVLLWRPISKLQSVAQLHQILATAAKRKGIEISLKRIEALCRRIGLRFKGRGRPRKIRIQTNLPASS
jgi:hypothetical protein